MIGALDLVDAIGQHLHASNVAYWDPDGTYPAILNVPPMFGKHQPPAPIECVTVNAYHVASPVGGVKDAVTTWRFQVRTRTNGPADWLAERIKNVLHDSHHQQWGGVQVDRCKHLTMFQLGHNASGHDERTDNYELITPN